MFTVQRSKYDLECTRNVQKLCCTRYSYCGGGAEFHQHLITHFCFVNSDVL